MKVTVRIGSSCHIKDSPEIVELFTKAIKENNLQDEVTLTGSFCIGECNRLGGTIQMGDVVHTGINHDNFKGFF